MPLTLKDGHCSEYVQRAIERRIVRRGLVEGAVAKAVRALGAKADMGAAKTSGTTDTLLWRRLL